MREKISRRDAVTLAIFVFVTIMAGGFGYLTDQIVPDQPKGNSLGMGMWLVLPLLTGIVLRIINKDLKQIGVKPNFKGNLKWYAAAFLVFPFTTLVDIILAKACGGLVTGDVALRTLPELVLTAFIGAFVKNIFEEFSWRGCLVPFLEKLKMNDWLLYGISGLIWGMWHITYYLFFLPDELVAGGSRPMLVVSGIILMIFWSPLFVELRRLTGSVWPCVILHAMEDAVPTLLFVTADVFRLKKGFSFMLDPVSGVVATVLMLLIGIALRQYRIKKLLTTKNICA